MSASAASQPTPSNGRSTHGVDTDTFAPQTHGFRNIAARDGYDAGDGYTQIMPQPWSQTASQASQSEYLRSGATYSIPRRRSFDANYHRDIYDPRYQGRGRPRSRDYVRDGYDSGSDTLSISPPHPPERRRRGHSAHRKVSRSRSRSRLRRKISGMFGSENDRDDGSENTNTKKWAATMAGALAGGFAARQAKKDHWVPTALGAFIGGFTAREAEKTWYKRKEEREKEEERWEGRRDRW